MTAALARVAGDAKDTPRVPPFDLEAERHLNAACVERADSFALIAHKLEPRHFYQEANRWVFTAVVELTKAGRDVDYLSVGGWLRDHERLVQIGGAVYLNELALNTAAIANVEQLADRVINLARARELIATAQQIAAQGYGVIADEVQEFLDGAEQKMFRLAQREDRIEIAPMSTVVEETYQRMRAAEARQGNVELPTGLRLLDNKIGGLGRGRVTVIAGRPGMGKTGFVMGIVEHIASIGGLCQVFSIEMPRWQLTMRMACSRANASVHRGLNGWLSAEERANVLLAQDQLKKLPIWIDETHVSLLQIRAKGRLVSAKTKQRPSLLVVDYLQLMRAPRERNVSRDEQLSEITAGFKQLAKELDCAVVYLSQLNREVEKRQDKRPMLSDLRESGGIEQDADDVLFLYRPEYYLRTKTPPEDVGVAEVIVAKQRNGPDGIVRVAFDGPTVTFSDLENRPEEVQEANQ